MGLNSVSSQLSWDQDEAGTLRVLLCILVGMLAQSVLVADLVMWGQTDCDAMQEKVVLAAGSYGVNLTVVRPRILTAPIGRGVCLL